MFFKKRLFKEYLNTSFTNLEFKFFIRSFSYACFAFLTFGLVIISIMGGFQLLKINLFNTPVLVIGILITAGSTIALLYYNSIYKNEPISVSRQFIKKIWIVLFFSYVFVFMFLFKLLLTMEWLGIEDNPKNIMKVVSICFSGTILCYMIPAVVGYLCQSHKTIITLYGLLKRCYIVYIILFLLSFLLMAFAFKITSYISYAILIIWGVILFASPILTFYRLKMISKYIDYTNQEDVFKWTMFFVFEILVQLMQMAFYLIKLIITISGSSRMSKRV